MVLHPNVTAVYRYYYYYYPRSQRPGDGWS